MLFRSAQPEEPEPALEPAQQEGPEADEAEGAEVPAAGELTPEALEAMPVVQLRVLARSLNVEGMTRREIRDAKREQLLTEIRSCLERRKKQP